jgi:RNA polymerase sigma-70 factor, ECF subfamily
LPVRQVPFRKVSRWVSLMNEQDRHDLYSELITRHQSQLYAYIFAIVRNQQDTDDLYQSVCLILWRKFELFRPGSSFFSWARQTAKREVRDYLKRKRVSTQVSEELLDAIAETPFAAQSDVTGGYLDALRQCREKLSALDEELLVLRYVENLGSREIAEQLQRPQQSVCNSLTRIRGWLLECVTKAVARQDRPTEEHS